ncbi:E3 ubiquitin-protein ligase RNF8-like isoform X1 [Daphnia pulex]|uniref:E3 ubiquitin-protein ligase RNF8-like isoform X1 n=1 Tax=Daphnia pulex TaxID=6669 RepID=UPI001EDE0523|nr:E3 ubiquitin-protein ligase RNF8-like isoform X1 [Daphnia pulex]
MARREQLDYLLARLRVQDKYLEVLTETSSNLVAEFVSEFQSNELAMSEQTEQSYRRRVIRCLVDVIKCGLCEKIGMLELYLHSSFQRAVEVEVESRLRQMKDLAAVRANIDAASDIQDRVARHHDEESDLDRLKRMEIELRCGICSELMVSATTLNCMHTYCQCCITHWKTFEEHRGTVARCPVCREFTVSEKRNYFADNLIGIIVDGYPEEEKNRRKELVASHQELLTQNVVTLPETNSANPSSVNLFGLFMTEIKKMLEDIKEFLAETSVLPVMPLIPIDPEPPQPTRPEQLPSSLVATVVPALGLPRGSSTPTSTGIHPLNQQRVSRREQRDRQTRPANGGIPGPQPQSIQRAANRRNQQSSARPASGRKVHGSLLARPRWRY